jgi:HAD superfamily hydrolase (TIGR01509 family)
MELFMGRSWPSNLATIERLLGGPAPAGLRERYDARRDAALAAVQPVDGVREALDAIDLPSCVASSGDHAKMAVTLGATGLLDRFRGRIFSAADLPDGRGKPAPDLFLHAARAMGWDPGSTAVVEDSAPGVQAGRAAGMAVFAYRLDAEGATRFDDMRALPGLLAS